MLILNKESNIPDEFKIMSSLVCLVNAIFVGIMTRTTYTPLAPTTREEIDPDRAFSRKMKVKGTNQESHEKNKPPSVLSCYVFKNQLPEYFQKTGLTTPVYETIKEGPSNVPIFKSTVVMYNATYDYLPGLFNRKAAKQSVAEVSLLALTKSKNTSSGTSQPVEIVIYCFVATLTKFKSCRCLYLTFDFDSARDKLFQELAPRLYSKDEQCCGSVNFSS
ncbi:hypothetical protein SASPL_120627 [Salvia splendens]|uniref:DRBM domain-containing protein n=1 Tax=Salvia splendens TaxID=180675 RepID=A0A8X8ZVG3_SALSN|nr:hypothetical protein SASPL_120627 [Salvia splendens]